MRPVQLIADGLHTTGWRVGPEDAPPAVLLHGVPTSAMLWSRLPEHLPDRPLLALDLPGYGGTAPLPVPSLPAHLSWLSAALSALGLPAKLHLVGQDYGGLLAALHATGHGAESLTLTSCPTGLLWLIPRLTATPPLHRYFYERHSGGLYLHHGVNADARAAFLAEFGEAAGQVGLSEMMRQTALHLSARTLWRLSGRLSGVATQLLWGDQDRFSPPITAAWTARRLGSARVLIEGGRHYVPFGRPAEYAAALRSWWTVG